MIIYKRKCPKCKRLQIFKTGDGFRKAEKRNSLCNSCSKKEAMNRPEVRAKQSIVQKEAHNRPEVRAKHIGKNNGNWRPRGKEYTRWQEYKLDVQRITRQQPLHLLENFDKRGNAGVKGAYQVDHIISIHEGFMRSISAEIIGNIRNLQCIPWEENLQKRDEYNRDKKWHMKLI